MLDEFTLIEDNAGSIDHLHIALVGDLFHGRTVHSKAEGLTIFKEVKVDLIAPPELSMPQQYVNKMKNNGFEVRTFSSLQEYLGQPDTANRFYFTRPQLERMGEEILKRQHSLREAVTFRKDFLGKVKGDTFFYHPMPRHKVHPTIPTFLDKTPLNHWEGQSINGMFTRITLLAAVAGTIGGDYQGKSAVSPSYEDEFIVEKPPHTHTKVLKEGINPLTNGVVIDRFCRGESKEQIWDYLFKTMNIMNFNRYRGSIGVGESKKEPGVYKGLIFLPETRNLSASEIRRLSAVTAGCTVNVIEDNRVVKKLQLSSPPRIYGIEGTCCPNESCISHPGHNENVTTEFIRQKNSALECVYCGTQTTFKNIWI